MKRYEIVEIQPKSLMKVILYIAVLPIVIFLLISLGMFIVSAATTGDIGYELLAVLPMLITPIMMVLAYSVIGILIALLYNFFSKKFGGLKITIREEE